LKTEDKLFNDARFFDALKGVIDSLSRKYNLETAKKRLKQTERYRERLIQHIEELERQVKKEKKK
jgi:hypothetical protein